MIIDTVFSLQTSIPPKHRPDVFADWDSGGGNVCKHKSRQGKVLKEIVVMILVHLGSNLILIYPVWVTGM